jgi:predicted AAA+ superfamily ATPase
MLELYKEYVVLGGMPEVVQDFVENSNFASALRLQRAIVSGYLDDIAKSERWGVKQGIKLSFDNVGQAGNVLTLPLYMTMFL